MACSKEEVFRCSEKVGESKDCTVKALALTTRLSYNRALQVMRRAGRKDKCGCRFDVWKRGFNLAGYSLLEVTQKIDAKTVLTFSRLSLPKDNNYVIKVRGHLLAARSNNVLDWTNGRRYRIIKVFQVISK